MPTGKDMTVRLNRWEKAIDMTHDTQFEEVHRFELNRLSIRVPDDTKIFFVQDWAIVLDPWPERIPLEWTVGFGNFIEPVQAPLFRVARRKHPDASDLDARLRRVEQALAIDAKLSFQSHAPAVVGVAGELLCAELNGDAATLLDGKREVALLVAGRLRKATD